jgi:hypothetical protein
MSRAIVRGGKLKGAFMRSVPARILVFAMFALMGSAHVFAASDTCDRACLKSTLDQYLNAVIKHDTSAVPLWAGFRETQNAVVVKPGAGLWKTMTGLGKVQRRYLDAVSGQAGYFGTILEGDSTDIVTLRMKVENHKVTEAEWVIARFPPGPPQPGRGPTGPDGLASQPPPDKPMPKSERSSRDLMVAVANSYFDGLQAHDGSIVISHPGCSRIENGGSVTGVGRGRGGQIEDRGDCAAHYDEQTMLAVDARRYPIVDEEAGVVLCMVIFQRYPGAVQKRNLLSEWLTIESGKIRSIYAAMFYPDPQVPAPNWPPYYGNWPLPEALPGYTPPPAPAGRGGGPGGPPPAAAPQAPPPGGR